MNRIKDNHKLTYKSAMTRDELFTYLKAIFYPTGILFISFFTIDIFGNYGKLLLSFMIIKLLLYISS